MANERELLSKLVDITRKQLERPASPAPMGADEQAMAEEEARRLAALRNPPRK